MGNTRVTTAQALNGLCHQIAVVKQQLLDAGFVYTAGMLRIAEDAIGTVASALGDASVGDNDL